jgi:uncharacterized OsmC-like protein
MATVVTGKYLGNKRVSVCHEDSGATFLTDAPKDNNGDGAQFSPTDLVGTSLGSCILTIMAIKAEQKEISIEGSGFSVEKEMQADPRRIGALRLVITLPASLTENQRKLMEAVAVTCPVHRSLHPDIQIDIEYKYQ